MHICHVSKCLVLSPQHWDLWSGIDLRLSRWVTGRTWWDLDDEWRQVDAMMPKDFEVQLCSTLHHYLIKCLRCILAFKVVDSITLAFWACNCPCPQHSPTWLIASKAKAVAVFPTSVEEYQHPHVFFVFLRCTTLSSSPSPFFTIDPQHTIVPKLEAMNDLPQKKQLVRSYRCKLRTMFLIHDFKWYCLNQMQRMFRGVIIISVDNNGWYSSSRNKSSVQNICCFMGILHPN